MGNDGKNLTINIENMRKQKIYRRLHYLLENPTFFGEFSRRYAYEKVTSIDNATQQLKCIRRDRVKPTEKTMKNIVEAYRYIMCDKRDTITISLYLLAEFIP